MTVFDVAVQDTAHPFECFDDPGVLHNDVAVMMTPPEVVWTVVVDPIPQLGDMKEVQLGDGEVVYFTALGLFHSTEKSIR